MSLAAFPPLDMLFAVLLIPIFVTTQGKVMVASFLLVEDVALFHPKFLRYQFLAASMAFEGGFGQ